MGTPRRKDIAGQRFGSLTAIKPAYKEKQRLYWECKCDCGNIHYVTYGNLNSGNTVSCGCRKKAIQENMGNVRKPIKHGSTKSRLYRIWGNMKTRCYNPNFPHYKYYGGRGIEICQDWLDDFSTFEKWALSNGYAENLTIDRIDNNGNYEPNNCRWVSMEIQNKNKRAIHTR